MRQAHDRLLPANPYLFPDKRAFIPLQTPGRENFAGDMSLQWHIAPGSQRIPQALKALKALSLHDL
jgi:hypothetical protein